MPVILGSVREADKLSMAFLERNILFILSNFTPSDMHDTIAYLILDAKA